LRKPRFFSENSAPGHRRVSRQQRGANALKFGLFYLPSIALREEIEREPSSVLMSRKNGRTGNYGIYDNPDARQVYYPKDYPWRCTGRIFTYTSWPTPNWSWSGSGVLIGPATC
jgi:hypothetical protein